MDILCPIISELYRKPLHRMESLLSEPGCRLVFIELHKF